MTEMIKLLLKMKAVKINFQQPFQWTSGKKLPIYVNNRIIGSCPRERAIVYQALAKIISQKFPQADMLIGVSTGGIIPAAFTSNYTNLPVGYVRSKPKLHGTTSQIEGITKPHAAVVIVEDLVSTAGSIQNAVLACRKAQLKVLGIIAVFSYQMAIAQQRLQDMEIPLYSLTNLNELLDAMQKNGNLTVAEVQTIRKKVQN